MKRMKRMNADISSLSIWNAEDMSISICDAMNTSHEKTRITIRRAPFNTRVVKRNGYQLFHTLREKMMWGADARE